MSVDRAVVMLEIYLTMAEVLRGGNELLLLLNFSTALVVSVQQTGSRGA